MPSPTSLEERPSRFSASSAPSQAGSPPSATVKTKEFRCTFQGCTKSFTRAEHLHRHALNHEEARGTACTRCNAVFKRADLLERHLARHKEKDDEAGGEGLGKLLTRKRLWKDSTGAIVQKRRPEHEKEDRKRSTNSESEATPRRRQSRARGIKQEPNYVLSPTRQNERTQSPRTLEPMNESDMGDLFLPGQMPTSSTHNGTVSHNGVIIGDDQWPMPNPIDEMPFEDAGFDSYEFLCNGSWGHISHANRSMGTSFEDFFAPDTATSYNTPIASINYYYWLFGNEPCIAPELTGGSISASVYPTNSSGESFRASTQDQTSMPFDYRDPRFQASLPSHGPENKHKRNQSTHVLPPISQDSFGSNSSTEFPGVASAVPPFAEFLAMSRTPDPNRKFVQREAPENGSEPLLHQPQAQHVDRYVSIYGPTPIESRSGHDIHRSIPRSRPPRRLPVIDPMARENILRFIDHSRPKTLEGYDILRDHPLLSPSTLQHFSDLYFRRFNTSYPLLHQATFIPSQIDPLLLVAILAIGASYSTKDDHQFAICLHNIMRGQIFGHISFTPTPPLWMLHTILLVECFGKSRAGQLQHDMSHLFHSILVNLIRKSDCQSARPQEHYENYDLEYRWRAEVDAEQRRRLALLCFMWDTQHAVLFSQSPCMIAAELQLSLPWNTALWEADTGEEWHTTNTIDPLPPPFQSTLKAYINAPSGTRPPSLNGLSRVLILHGMMSVARDLTKRDETSLGTGFTLKDESWQARITGAYNLWKADFDIYSQDVFETLDDHSSEKSEFQRFNVAYLALHHAAQIAINVDILDLQIYAGAGHILGRPVLDADRSRSRRRIEKWIAPPAIGAAYAASHAAFLIRDGITKLHSWDAGDVFHYPWCLYLATLTCWGFQTAIKNSIGHNFDGSMAGMQGSSEDDADLDSRAEMNALVGAMTRSKPDELWKVAGKYRAEDLPRVIAKQLGSVRWAVVQEGMLVLRGLIERRGPR